MPYTASSGVAEIEVEDQTYLKYSGPTSGYYYVELPVTATLYDKFTGKGIQNAGEEVDFELPATSCSAYTVANGGGVANCNLPLPIATGSYVMTVNYSGDSTYMPATLKVPFKVLNSINTVTGSGVAAGDVFSLTASYVAGGKTPTGSFKWTDTTQKVAFASTSLVGLGVMSGTIAYIGGAGTENGKSGYKFLVTAVAGGAGTGQVTVVITGKTGTYTESGQLTSGSITIH